MLYMYGRVSIFLLIFWHRSFEVMGANSKSLTTSCPPKTNYRHRIGKNVARLPCGHVFDKNCIRKWLIDNCTCPICRYELETDSPSYEKGRLQRMAKRKPRFHTHELERMSVKELQELCERINLSSVSRKIDVVEKTDLLDLILKSEKIDVVKTAKPAAYKLSELRAMGVRELKKTMANVGVLFDPIDVLEKEDMVQIFVNSSRLIVNSESNQKCGNSKSPRRIDNSANENNKNSSAKKKRKISSCASVSQNTTTVHNPTTEKIDEDTEQRNQTVEQVEDESQPSRWSWLSNMFCFPAGFCFNSE